MRGDPERLPDPPGSGPRSAPLVRARTAAAARRDVDSSLSAVASTVKPFKPAKPGTKLGGYDVHYEIGRGAASIIYLVQDAKTKQIWALKHVRKDGPKDQRFLDQAEAEYQVAQKLSSPYLRNIERLIRARERLIATKELFLVMEYVDGVSVELRPPKSFEQAVEIFLQTARGLADHHAAGFVHADMKPNNIVAREDGRVKIIDLGQACAIGTVKERIQGTPDYIAPEQVHRREITPRTDVYNLGATMYWVLTQQHIPTAMSNRSDSLVEGLDDDLIERPVPACERNPRVPKALSDLIDQCVAVSPDDRPASMQDLIVVLEEVLEDLRAGAPDVSAS